VAGIEPATRRLTAARPYQHEHHRNKFHLNSWPFDNHAGEIITGANPAFHPIQLFGLESVQGESNPHFRHGKAVGYRYIMDAFLFLIVRLRSEGL
jgi:hypothetical protein